MDDFLTTVFRGLHPHYLLFVILGIASDIRTRRWRSCDTLLLVLFIVFELFAVFQVWMFYGELDTCQRYMWIAIPLYLPFAARGVAAIWDMLKKFTSGRIAVSTFAAFFAAYAILAAYNPIYKGWTSDKKRIPRRISQQAAAWIRNDWNAPKSLGQTVRLRCDRYSSGRRPVVQSKCLRIGYLCGGQAYFDFLREDGVHPDYIVTQDRDDVAPGYVRVAEIAVEGQKAYICKRIEECP